MFQLNLLGKEQIFKDYNIFFRLQKNNSCDKTGDASNSGLLNGVKNDADDHSADPSSDEDADEDGVDNGGLSDEEELVDLEDLGSFVKVIVRGQFVRPVGTGHTCSIATEQVPVNANCCRR